MSRSDVERSPNLAAAYVRMSTEHQQYSTSNQMDIIRQYADRRGLTIVRTYSDEGKSGLNLHGRDSLTQMIRDVQTGGVVFSCILAYDVSRWGRFQDTDESAYYEYVCRQAGVAVHYCAEQFDNDGSPISAIVKGVKRAMAGEYSRELSSKVFQGACRLIQLGYKQGGTAGFGLRRMLVDSQRQLKSTLKIGEKKSIQTDRVILGPGPDEEVKLVQWMYHAFVEEQKDESEIAGILNARNVCTDFGRAWTRSTVHEVLTNEKYIGNNVYHRKSFKLQLKHVLNPREKWIRAEGAFQAIVDRELFDRAQSIVLARSRRLTNEEMLEKLRGLLGRHGRLTDTIIDEAEDVPSSSAFRNRFGSLVLAYRQIDYGPHIHYRFIELNRRLRKEHEAIVTAVVYKIQELGGTVEWNKESRLLYVNGELRVSIVLCRHFLSRAGSSRWVVRLDGPRKPDITVVVRMDEANQSARDYYLLPAIDTTWGRRRIGEDNGIYLDAYRFDTLEYFFKMAERIRLKEAA